MISETGSELLGSASESSEMLLSDSTGYRRIFGRNISPCIAADPAQIAFIRCTAGTAIRCSHPSATTLSEMPEFSGWIRSLRLLCRQRGKRAEMDMRTARASDKIVFHPPQNPPCFLHQFLRGYFPVLRFQMSIATAVTAQQHEQHRPPVYEAETPYERLCGGRTIPQTVPPAPHSRFLDSVAPRLIFFYVPHRPPFIFIVCIFPAVFSCAATQGPQTGWKAAYRWQEVGQRQRAGILSHRDLHRCLRSFRLRRRFRSVSGSGSSGSRGTQAPASQALPRLSTGTVYFSRFPHRSHTKNP